MTTKISVTAAADVFGVGDRRVRQLMREFDLPYADRGHVPFEEFASKFIAKIKAGASERPADARLKAVKADEIDTRIIERRRELIPLEDADTAIGAVIGFVEDAADGAGGLATRDRETAARIDDAITETIAKARERAARVVAALKRGHDPHEVI